MQFINQIAILTFILTTPALALPELKTKQALDRLLFTSSDGKITYYRKNSGELQLSLNYKVATIMKSPANTLYQITSDDKEKFIAIEQIISPHRVMNYFQNNRIFVAVLGKATKAKLVGQGTSPQIHLDGKWMSYFDKVKNEINIVSLVNDTVPPKIIQIKNKLNPFFIPKVKVLTPEHILYTDINSKGYEALLMYSLLDKSFETVFKSKNPGNKVSYCESSGELLIQETPIGSVKSSSQIIQLPLYNNTGFKNTSILYSTEFADIPGIVCHKDKVYFVKTNQYNSKLNLRSTEVAELDPTKKQVKVLSNMKYIEQVIPFAGMILASAKGKYYIVKNNTALKSDEIARPEKFKP